MSNKVRLKELLDEMLKATLNDNLESLEELADDYGVEKILFQREHKLPIDKADPLDVARNQLFNVFQMKEFYGEDSKQHKRALELAPKLVKEAKKFIDNPKR